MGNSLAQQRRKQSEESPLEEIVIETLSIITCEICVESVSSDKLFKNRNKCAHPYCLDCITKYIDAKLDYSMSQIICPALNCDHHLDPLSCRPFISSLVFDKWCDLLCETAVLEIDRCYCPHGECSVLILNECGERVKKSTCPNCKKLFCFSCHTPWHAGYSCDEGRELRDANDYAVGVLAEKEKWQRCPACHHCVERISGCNYVTCRCGTRFCYNCGKKVKVSWCKCSTSFAERTAYILITLLTLVLCLIFFIPGLLVYIVYKFAHSLWQIIAD
ncbi:E3 ubiquitin-protein ligase RSL1-like [Apium graveolens]|uniref:E3 ubiquitin-protein ligase RSL1-like n=1 Tax=Apium graveolens TaxID=4045 RepID=UPI003D7AE62B